MVTEALRAFDWTGKHILVACSGGVDSMTLLQGLLQLGFKPEVFHVNYGLRGAESDADAELVRKICRQNDLQLHLQEIDGLEFKKGGLNLQNEARNVRRDFFQSWTSQSSNHVVALAHHADDQEETFFLQYLRGAGIIGLGAIYPERGQLLRPFLHLPKSTLIGWAKEHSVEWREDASNSTAIYARNRLRNAILPKLHETQPGLTESVRILSECFRKEVALIGKKLEDLLQQWEKLHELPVTAWTSLTHSEKEVLLNRIDVSTGAVGEMDKLAEMGRGKQLILGHYCFYRTRDAIAGKMQLFRYQLETALVDKLPDSFSLNEAYFDAEKLSGGLQLRNWTKDDFIEPVGMKGRISVEKALKDGGISKQERSHYLVVADAEDILWLPGLRISKHKLANAGTSQLLKVRVRPSMENVRS